MPKKNSLTFQPLKKRTVHGLEIPGSDYPLIQYHVTENRNSQLLSVCIYTVLTHFFKITDEEDSPVIRGFSDDEPLVIA
jgi:hypothetical protein